MNLKIPKDKAIQILRQRIAELSEHSFTPKAWKDKTENDLKEIFPLGSTQWLQISTIQFDTYITSDKQRVLQEGKDTGRRLLNSYIEFIENYSEIAEQRQAIKESNYQDKYNKLLGKWNELAPQWNELLEKHQSVLGENNAKDETIEGLQNEIVQITKNTVQFDNISVGKVFKAIKNLPIGQLIAVIGFLITIIAGSFKLGLMYQENSMNNANYQLNKQNDINQELLKQKDSGINTLKSEISKLKQKNDTSAKK
jgi:hypothetical protein